MHQSPSVFWRRLLFWYKKSGRVLPWRVTRDPYAIWVSEMMLQQTQVATVLPYYHRFLSTFPTVQDLAVAPLDAVLTVWQGMGYYARARSLHRAAGMIVEKFKGIVPLSYESLLLLPGIGRSTAGAILNIAALQRYPILDGNVKRILVRYFGIRQDPQQNKVQEKLWRLAHKILPPSRVDIFTQAIMDLGAIICLPKAPNCMACPVRQGCKTYRTGIKFLARSASKKIPHYTHVAAILRNGDNVLIKKRPQEGLLGGLWEFPGGRMESGEDFSERVEKEVGAPVMIESNGTILQQTFTHFKMTLHLVEGSVKRAKPPFLWVPIDRLLDYPFSSAHLKIARKLQCPGNDPRTGIGHRRTSPHPTPHALTLPSPLRARVAVAQASCLCDYRPGRDGRGCDPCEG